MSDNITEAFLLDKPPTFSEQPLTEGEKRRYESGLRYERRVCDALSSRYPNTLRGPWIKYRNGTQYFNFCQPDAIIFHEGRLILVEIKLTHTRSARQKLICFYGPIVQHIYPDYTQSYVQIYKNWRPRAHKEPFDINDLLKVPEGLYRECQWI